MRGTVYILNFMGPNVNTWLQTPHLFKVAAVSGWQVLWDSTFSLVYFPRHGWTWFLGLLRHLTPIEDTASSSPKISPLLICTSSCCSGNCHCIHSSAWHMLSAFCALSHLILTRALCTNIIPFYRWGHWGTKLRSFSQVCRASKWSAGLSLSPCFTSRSQPWKALLIFNYLIYLVALGPSFGRLTL